MSEFTQKTLAALQARYPGPWRIYLDREYDCILTLTTPEGVDLRVNSEHTSRGKSGVTATLTAGYGGFGYDVAGYVTSALRALKNQTQLIDGESKRVASSNLVEAYQAAEGFYAVDEAAKRKFGPFKSYAEAEQAQWEMLAERRGVFVHPRPLADWRPEHGDVVWWWFPVTKPPYIGQPEDTDWPGIHTHWTPIPKEPNNTGEVDHGK